MRQFGQVLNNYQYAYAAAERIVGLLREPDRITDRDEGIDLETVDGDVDEADLRDALRKAGALSFVDDLDDGLDTVVGERGVKLSGGQRQRLAIARAILEEPSLLVLDEATSHVDNETEVVVQRNVADTVADRTTFVIAHRLSTVRDADRIVVLEEGRVAESGTHEELLESDGLYAALWRVQVGEVESLPEGFVETGAEPADD